MKIIVSGFKQPTEEEKTSTHVWVEVSITPAGNFWAYIKKNRTGAIGSVKVGGLEWKDGAFKEFQPEIIKHCIEMAVELLKRAYAIE